MRRLAYRREYGTGYKTTPAHTTVSCLRYDFSCLVRVGSISVDKRALLFQKLMSKEIPAHAQMAPGCNIQAANGRIVVGLKYFFGSLFNLGREEHWSVRTTHSCNSLGKLLPVNHAWLSQSTTVHWIVGVWVFQRGSPLLSMSTMESERCQKQVFDYTRIGDN